MRRIHRTDLGIKHVDLGHGDWAEVRTRALAGDRAYIQKRSLRYRQDVSSGDDGGVLFDMGAGNMAALERMVTAWGGPGFCVRDHDADGTTHTEGENGCKPIRLDREAIEALDQETFDLILAAVNDRSEIANGHKELSVVEGSTANPQ